MKTFLRTRVRLFGQSIGLGWLLLAVSAVTALAAFGAFTLVSRTRIVAKKGALVSYTSGWSCVVLAGSGIATTCGELGSGAVDAVFESTDAGSIVAVSRGFQNDTPAAALCVSVANASSGPLVAALGLPASRKIALASAEVVRVDWSMPTLAPNDDVTLPSWQLIFDPVAPGAVCP